MWLFQKKCFKFCYDVWDKFFSKKLPSDQIHIFFLPHGMLNVLNDCRLCFLLICDTQCTWSKNYHVKFTMDPWKAKELPWPIKLTWQKKTTFAMAINWRIFHALLFYFASWYAQCTQMIEHFVSCSFPMLNVCEVKIAMSNLLWSNEKQHELPWAIKLTWQKKTTFAMEIKLKSLSCLTFFASWYAQCTQMIVHFVSSAFAMLNVREVKLPWQIYHGPHGSKNSHYQWK